MGKGFSVPARNPLGKIEGILWTLCKYNSLSNPDNHGPKLHEPVLFMRDLLMPSSELVSACVCGNYIHFVFSRDFVTKQSFPVIPMEKPPHFKSAALLLLRLLLCSPHSPKLIKIYVATHTDALARPTTAVVTQKTSIQ